MSYYLFMSLLDLSSYRHSNSILVVRDFLPFDYDDSKVYLFLIVYIKMT